MSEGEGVLRRLFMRAEVELFIYKKKSFLNPHKHIKIGLLLDDIEIIVSEWIIMKKKSWLKELKENGCGFYRLLSIIYYYYNEHILLLYHRLRPKLIEKHHSL